MLYGPYSITAQVDDELDLLIRVMVDRMNSLESILVSSLFGFLITTTLSIFAAVYFVRTDESDKDIKIPALGLFVGISILYGFLSGYYYWMLTNFYAAIAILGQI